MLRTLQSSYPCMLWVNLTAPKHISVKTRKIKVSSNTTSFEKQIELDKIKPTTCHEDKNYLLETIF